MKDNLYKLLKEAFDLGYQERRSEYKLPEFVFKAWYEARKEPEFQIILKIIVTPEQAEVYKDYHYAVNSEHGEVYSLDGFNWFKLIIKENGIKHSE